MSTSVAGRATTSSSDSAKRAREAGVEDVPVYADELAALRR